MRRICIIALAVIAGPARAEDTETKQPSGAATGLDRGLELLEDGEAAEAAAVLYGAVRASQPGDARHERIQYHLARTLGELGLHLAADELLAAVVRNRTVPELVPAALGLLLEDLETGRSDGAYVETVLLDLDVGNLAGEYGAAVAYYQGLADLKQGRLRWAETSLRNIADPRYAQRATLALGAFHLARGDVETARQSFARVAEAPDAPEQERSLATLSLARLAADQGLEKRDRKTLEEARKLYDEVRRPHSVSAEVLLERAWLDFHLGDLRRALGYLLALDAPAHRDRVLPDKYVLRALIYSRACHYRAARQTALRLPRDFGDTISAVRERRDPEESPVLQRVLAMEVDVAPLEDLRRRVERQRRLANDVEESGLRKWLTEVYGRLQADGSRHLAAARRRALPHVGRALLDAVADLRVVSFELALKLHRRVRGETVRDARLGAAPPLPLGGSDVYFPFDGEYWDDELSDLVVYLEDRCVE